MMRDLTSSAFLRTFSLTSPVKAAVSIGDVAPDATPLPNVSLGKLSVPVDLAYLRPVQSCTADIARMLSYPDGSITMLQLAVEEAFTNAVKHFSRSPGAGESIHVEFKSDGGDFVITIRDRGMPFEIDEVESYDKSAADEADRPGLGLTLMKSSVDKVEVISAGRDGKEVRLSKRLPINAILPEGVVRAGLADAPAERRVLDLNKVPVRFPSEGDLPAIRRLAWKCVGYDCAGLFYDLSKLRSLLAEHLYLPVIAADPETGEAVYHVALMLDSPGDVVPVEGLEFADPEVSCAELPNKAALILFEIARRRGCRGVRILSPVNAPAAQKNAASVHGSAPSAALMAHTPGTRANDDETAAPARTSSLVHFVAMDHDAMTVHIPERHTSIVEEIYGWLGLTRKITPGHDTPLSRNSIVECDTDPDAHYSVIRARTIGIDTVEQIHNHLNEVRRNGSEAVSVWLAADSPATPEVVRWCEKVGLSFAGIIPYYFEGSDAILLQWVGVPLDLGSARIQGDRAKRLFEYVKSNLGY